MKITPLLLLVVLLVSCNNIAGWFGDNSDSTSIHTSDSALAGRPITRDMSIDQSNAYSDLFLDSAAVEQFIREKKIQEADAVRDFYKVRNYQFAWFSSAGPTEQARNFWHLENQEKINEQRQDVKDALKERMDTLLLQDSLVIHSTDSSYVHTELELTSRFAGYARSNKDGFFNASNFYYAVPAKKIDAMQLADSLLHKQKDSSRYSANKTYSALKQHLALYYEAAKSGGWDSINLSGIKKGGASPAVTALKKRLHLMGDYASADTGNVYSDSLAAAISSFQERHGLKPTGTINDSTSQALNVPAEERIRQILVNMDRALWTGHATDSNYIYVNLPSYMLYVFEEDRKVFDMPVVAGREGYNTFSFNGHIKEIIFSPYWNVPESIVRNELMPKMKKDPAYLQKRNMEIVNKNDSIPVVRQLPGKKNELGKVKFMIPNGYDIYLHDTPDKGVFTKNDRGLSHGCIRVADAAKLAQYLLKDQKEWTPERISRAMNSNKEEKVKVDKPAAVVIGYHTAWVDEKGRLNFRKDAYGHDASLASRLFTGGRQATL